MSLSLGSNAFESFPQYPIRNKVLLVKSAVTLAFVITFFFLHSAPDIQKLSLGWTALLGAVLLLILADRYVFPINLYQSSSSNPLLKF